MKYLSLFSLLFWVSLNLVSAKAKQEQPNIIFIICDQMRGDAFGASGNSVVNTPNIDKLANEGVMFSNAFVNNPVCIPSRVSMFSGKYPTETGVYCNRSKTPWLNFEKSFPWYLKQAGYTVGYVGKNHAFIRSELDKFDQLNERNREKCRAYSKFVPPNWHCDIFWPEEDCNPAKNSQDAVDFINKNDGKQPFFLTVSYFDPHPPYMAPARVTSKYCSNDIILPEYINPENLGERISNQQKALMYDKQTKYDLKETMRYYYSAIEWGVDEQVGKIIKALEEKGICDNTVIVFTSDHGDFMGEFNMVRKGMFMYDALMHVPMVWYAPGYIKKGLKVDKLVQNVDIFPTLLDLACTDIPKDIAGKSLKGLLNGEDVELNKYVFGAAAYSTLPEKYWEDPEPYYNPKSEKPFHSRVEDLTWESKYKTAMVRTKDWKLIVSETDKPELFFMDGKGVERKNLFGDAKYNAIFLELKAKIQTNWDHDFLWQ